MINKVNKSIIYPSHALSQTDIGKLRMLIKWALVCAILMEEDRIQDIYIYIYKRKTKENTYANKICKTKEREKKV